MTSALLRPPESLSFNENVVAAEVSCSSLLRWKRAYIASGRDEAAQPSCLWLHNLTLPQAVRILCLFPPSTILFKFLSLLKSENN